MGLANATIRLLDIINGLGLAIYSLRGVRRGGGGGGSGEPPILALNFFLVRAQGKYATSSEG